VELLETQPRFEIVPGFRRNGKKYQAVHYTSDFRIIENGREIVVEVKSEGVLRANVKSYPMRRKLFLKAFPELVFREIIFMDNGERVVREY